ncbi:hypothetical protein PGSY75_0419300 [Plasmodium gaboni]|uniref:Uncharacterized protein n=1 Tax=Plasmodium gaboni TaxID=647221 RepID=A0A151LUM9_9APIC|nr:hypothetical protein PGSY75_0419300 [Plasmodium gaboni]KYO02887.1 hypothetical protein PGSY75_0419300 [Plasmodium gaboni]
MKCRPVDTIFEASSFNKSKRNKLEFYDEKLNEFFENGIINYSLLEIVGECGTGKTQLALTICADELLNIYERRKKEKKKKNEQYNHDDIKRDIVFYIYANRTFPIHRLIEIIEAKIKKKENSFEYYKNKKEDHVNKYQSNNVECKENIINSHNITHNERDPLDNYELKENEYMIKKNIVKSVLKNLYIYKINDEKDFFCLFEKDIFYILKYYNISILVIDSLNYIFRGMEEKFDNNKKKQFFIQISLLLKKISYEHNFFVFLINSTNNKKDYLDFSYDTTNTMIHSSCSNTVIYLKKIKSYNSIRRTMSIKYSEFLVKYKSINFQITHEGFHISG